MNTNAGSLANGLIGAWCPSLGATGGVLVDRSPYRRNGTLTGSWATTAGGGQSFSVSGGTQGTAPGSISVGGKDYSVSLWAYFNAANGIYSSLFDKGTSGTREAGLFVQSAGNLSYFANSSVPTGIVVLSLGAWSHVCVTVTSAGSATFYQNGVQTGTSSTGAATTSTADWSFGGNPTGATTFNGSYDDIRIYSRVLTLAEIRTLASRRGVGLRQTRQRRVQILGSQFWLKDSGTWKKATAWTKVNGVWKQGTPKINAGGTWK